MVQFFHPVNVRVEIRIDRSRQLATIGIYQSLLVSLFGISECHVVGNLGVDNLVLTVVVASLTGGVGFVDGIHILNAINQVGHLGQVCNTLIDIERKLWLADLTRLGGDDNNTVTTAHTIDSSRGGILQNSDRLDVLGRQAAPATLNTVDKHQRPFILIGKCRDTANPDV